MREGRATAVQLPLSVLLCSSYRATPLPVSEPAQARLTKTAGFPRLALFTSVCAGAVAVGTLVSSTIVSLLAPELLPAASRYWTYTLLAPFPLVRGPGPCRRVRLPRGPARARVAEPHPGSAGARSWVARQQGEVYEPAPGVRCARVDRYRASRRLRIEVDCILCGARDVARSVAKLDVHRLTTIAVDQRPGSARGVRLPREPVEAVVAEPHRDHFAGR